MKVWVVVDEGCDGCDVIHGVYASARAAHQIAALCSGGRVEEHEVFGDADDAPLPKKHLFQQGIFGRASEEYLCRVCGDVESTH